MLNSKIVCLFIRHTHVYRLQKKKIHVQHFFHIFLIISAQSGNFNVAKVQLTHIKVCALTM